MLNYKKTNIIFITLFTLLVLLCVFVKVNWWWGLALFAARFVIFIVGSCFINLNFHVNAFCNNPLESQKNIAITFDDGPSENTLLVLDLLKKHNAKAAFFCIGKRMEKHPDIVRKIILEGHIVGNHSYSHSQFFDFYSKKRIVAEIKKTNAIIEKVGGVKTQLFRPPYGVTNPSIRKALEITKHIVIGWNIRSLDGILKNEKNIYNRITKRITPGGILLLHDTSLHSVKVLERLLLYLEKKKYTVVSLEQLLKIKAYEV
ncbi:polysaccharide deacetylase family protein [Flavobacterium sp.]|uniref:polysaccharide deacetylase family protein n=1 Tax=Flavobacterium sp. TaxID=239 RepID=UPI0025FBAD16|nr:polysaccharide deacetylase family protein [Flavobacterium sp.]